MLGRLLRRLRDLADAAIRAVRCHLADALHPTATSSLLVGAATDLVRSKPEPVVENAFLRQQVIVLARSTRRPRIGIADRALLVLLASRLRNWRQTLVIVQ